jgi:hypothetical protein
VVAKLGIVEYACNPSYLGGGDSRMKSLRAVWEKKDTIPYLKKQAK